jgi:hypothetical protein
MRGIKFSQGKFLLAAKIKINITYGDNKVSGLGLNLISSALFRPATVA